MEKKPWYINSSTGEGLGFLATGLTLEGAVQMVGLILSWIGHPIDPDTLAGFAKSVVAVVAAIIAFIGVLRKMRNALIGTPPAPESGDVV